MTIQKKKKQENFKYNAGTTNTEIDFIFSIYYQNSMSTRYGVKLIVFTCIHDRKYLYDAFTAQRT